MKTTFKILAVLVAMVGFSAASYAQSNASATIITPISIAVVDHMNFGNVAASGSLGTVVLTTAGARSVTGGVSLPTTTGTVSAANFTVSGQANFTYSITLPSSVTITRVSGSETMTVNTFTSDPATTGTIGGGGTQSLSVGATLNVAASQVAGAYTSGSTFNVTVAYN
ncbi:MAG: hypothetical protein A2X19_10670 [Bacteroidetes bacterium GWE2_39_28]|nr:MAG: hypothetical protein A2X19_10670 [Bacteroidetes bacterium GWE2_39_28]OFY13539.1 MAG: hypothetical protein A2X16_07710 [Bacteroidetes bacterium GWF2_39_10]OFZ06644.1 MAG: hypothetical protein A2322_02130 [Bacteroidetes bacterium RIFOXYB2_FULL_39_7]OFZ11698.1 MAG: hypothetical protein A2465_05715 [Bacteroidetes bacterium RIFOXYC2_FULL_39_11]HCT94873.1 hypothetical protein [Rikenellaceae bacterium]